MTLDKLIDRFPEFREAHDLSLKQNQDRRIRARCEVIAEAT
jgi:hypothetical protein